jgi:hypothetical protein
MHGGGSPTDQHFDVLSRRPRRKVIELVDRNDTVSVAEVVAHIEGPEHEARLTLEHTHLPKLADTGYITWDRLADEISQGPQFPEIEPLIELFRTHPDSLPIEWP